MTFFTVTTSLTEGQVVKQKFCSDGEKSERIADMLRAGYVCEGGFIVNTAGHAVMELVPGFEYKFINFKRKHRASFDLPLTSAPTTSSSESSAKADSPTEPAPSSVEEVAKAVKTKKPSDGVPSEASEGAKKIKKPKKIVDPKAPKKPLSAYNLYMADNQNDVKAQHPELSSKDVMAFLGKSWSELEEGKKGSYNMRATRLKDEYLVQLRQYAEENPSLDLTKKLATMERTNLKLHKDEAKTEHEEASTSNDEDEEEAPAFHPGKAEKGTKRKAAPDSDEDSDEEGEVEHVVQFTGKDKAAKPAEVKGDKKKDAAEKGGGHKPDGKHAAVSYLII